MKLTLVLPTLLFTLTMPPMNDAGEALETKPAPCLAFGGIEDLLAAQKIAGQLTRAGFTAELKTVDTATGRFDHRVLLSAVPSLQGAYRKLRELKSRAIDGHVITSGEDSPGVSLGVFASQNAAGKHQQDLTRLGYETHIKAIPRLTRRYQIIVKETVPQAITRSIQATFPATRPMKQKCPDAFIKSRRACPRSLLSGDRISDCKAIASVLEALSLMF